MSTLRISDAPLLPDVDGSEKIPTGGRGDYAISIDQIKGHIFQDIGKELVGLGNVDNTSDLDKPVSTAQQAALNLKADKTYVDLNLDLKADKTNVYTRSETTLALSQKADLVGGVIPSNQLPSYVDDVVEVTTSTLPVIGESGKIYITTDTNRTWRWSGNQYVEISNGGVSDSTLKLQTPRKIANVDFDGTQNIDIPHNNLTSRNVENAHTAVSISTESGENQQEINDYTGAKWRNKAGGYDLNAHVMLENGDIVKSTVAGNTVDPNTTMTGWVSEIYKAIGNTGYLYVSKLKGDGTDETNAFQQELNQVANLNTALGGGVNYKCNRKGTVLISHVIMPTVTGMIIDFTGTVFKVPDGTNVLDKDVLRFNSIKKSYVFNLSMDGNSANLPDDTSGLGQWIGRCIMFRLGNNSEDCIFFNTKVVNSLYCASQWGNNISNITFQNIEFDNIGEHVFYLSGSGGGLVNGVYFEGVLGGNFGTNPNAALNNHEVAFVKSSNTIGVNDDFQIQDATFKQTSTIPYGAVICTNYDLLRLKLKNITVTDKISALVYPRGRAHYCDIENVYSSETGLTRIVYTHSANSEVKRYTAKNINLATAAQHHMQVFDYVCDSKLLDIRPTMPTGVTYELDKKCTYERVLFLGRLTNMNNIEFDYNFNDCNFQASAGGGTGVLDSIGSASWTDGKYLTFNNCKIPNSTAASYSIATQNNNARLRLLDMPDVIRPLFNRASTTMKLLEINGTKFPYSQNPLANTRPSNSILRGLMGYDGSQLRNFLKWSGSVTVASGSTSNTINLASAIARPITVQDIHVVEPANMPSGAIYTVSVLDNIVTITMSASATGSTVFLIKVDVSD